MIKIDDKVVDVKKFPDGTFLLKVAPSDFTSAKISWYFDDNDELVSLIYIVNHLRDNGTSNISLFMPYIPNARQDRVKNDDDVFTLKHFAWVINSLKFDNVYVLDPHSAVSEALINNIRVGSPKQFIQQVMNKVIKQDDKFVKLSDTAIIFYPDEGAMKRYSGLIQHPYAFGIKERDWNTGKIKGLSVVSDGIEIVGKNVLIVDDISSRGGTFYHSAKKLKELGANKIFLYITHCENTILEGELITSGLIDRIYTTNSLFTAKHEMIEVMSL